MVSNTVNSSAPVTNLSRLTIFTVGVEASPILEGKRVTRAGEDFYNLTEFRLPFRAKKIHVHFGNLFEGNKQLGNLPNI